MVVSKLLVVLTLAIFSAGLGLWIRSYDSEESGHLESPGIVMTLIGLIGSLVLNIAFAWFHLSQV